MASRQHGTAGALDGHDWRAAGEAWGSSANDWSCLYEHYSIDVLIALFVGIGVGPTTRLLDIACGSGLGTRVADAMGATVTGIDAAAELVAIARERKLRKPGGWEGKVWMADDFDDWTEELDELFYGKRVETEQT